MSHFKISTPYRSLNYYGIKSALLLVLCTLPLLFMPKVNLTSMEGETAGVRIDDLILMTFTLVLLFAHFSLHKGITDIEKWIIILTGFSFLSYFSNRFFVSYGWLHVNANIFYCVRLFEYFLFFYVGAFASQFFKLSSIIKALFLWNASIMVLQKLGLVGGMTNYGYAPQLPGAVIGTAGFASEMGLVLSLLFAYFLYSDKPLFKSSIVFPLAIKKFLTNTRIFWILIIFGVLGALTGNRMCLMAMLICFFFKLVELFRRQSLQVSLVLTGLFLALVFGLALVVMNTPSISNRSGNLFSFKNFTLIGLVWEEIDLTHSPIGNETVEMGEYDPSWWMRIHKWCYALKTYVMNPECYLQGVGPGFAFAALDGGYLRILVEYGLIGCFIFWNFFSCIMKQNKQLKWMMVAFLINMLTFETYLSYKGMSLLLLATGYAYSQKAAEANLQGVATCAS